MTDEQNLQNIRDIKDASLMIDAEDDSSIIDAEDAFLRYVHEIGEIPKTITLDDFSEWTLGEVFSDIEINVLSVMVENHDIFEREYDYFFKVFLKASADARTKYTTETAEEIKNFIDSLPIILSK